MKRILFVSEAVTLAQVVRLVTLARALDPSRYEVHFASARFDPLVFEGTAFHRHPIRSISPKRVERATAWGFRLYTRPILEAYVAEELELLRRVRPALVVEDLRWSLRVSAPVFGVPHAALINAYWSPHVARTSFPLPDHPIVRLLGERLAGAHFHKALPWVFRHFAAPLNALRSRHGLPPFDGLLELLVGGDFTLYPDAPGMFPTRALPPTHRFLGPIHWAPRLAQSVKWTNLGQYPIIYMTPGSSGNVGKLGTWVEALSAMPVEVLLATAGRPAPRRLPPNVHAADFLPGDEAARRAAVVVCNGGSSTGYQALAEGKPVIGLPWNLDQYLHMAVVAGLEAGAWLRATTATGAQLQALIQQALDGRFTAGALRAQAALRERDAPTGFRSWVDNVLS